VKNISLEVLPFSLVLYTPIVVLYLFPMPTSLSAQISESCFDISLWCFLLEKSSHRSFETMTAGYPIPLSKFDVVRQLPHRTYKSRWLLEEDKALQEGSNVWRGWWRLD
jgi:hypothetical protein